MLHVFGVTKNQKKTMFLIQAKRMQWVNLEEGTEKKIRTCPQPVFVYKYTKNVASLVRPLLCALSAAKWLKTSWKQVPVAIYVCFCSAVLFISCCAEFSKITAAKTVKCRKIKIIIVFKERSRFKRKGNICWYKWIKRLESWIYPC